MTDEEGAFHAAILHAPGDENVRGVFADWLDENGRPEEAARQRKYVPAMRWLRAFSQENPFFRLDAFFKKRYPDAYPDGGDPDDRDAPYGQLLMFLEAHLAGDDVVLSFVPPGGEFDDYSDELWDHFSVVTGYEVPEEVRETETAPFFPCSC